MREGKKIYIGSVCYCSHKKNGLSIRKESGVEHGEIKMVIILGSRERGLSFLSSHFFIVVPLPFFATNKNKYIHIDL